MIRDLQKRHKLVHKILMSHTITKKGLLFQIIYSKSYNSAHFNFRGWTINCWVGGYRKKSFIVKVKQIAVIGFRTC